MGIVYFVTNRKASFLRGLLTLALGICLLVWPAGTLDLLIKLIAGFLLLMGVITLTFSLNAKGRGDSSGIPTMVIINVLVYIIFGLLIFLFPHFFVELIAFLFGAVLLIAGIGQLINLYYSSKYAVLSGWTYVIPVLVTVCGIALFFFTKESTNTLTLIFGGAVTLYGISELYSAWTLRKVKFNKQGIFEQEKTTEETTAPIVEVQNKPSDNEDFAEDVPYEEIKED